MIQLNLDFYLLSKYFGISASKIHQYANKDIDEIMKLEARQGNVKARDYKKILSNPDKLLQIFKLANVQNKMIILRNLSENDLDNLLPYLKDEDLIKGLYFFSEDKLMFMCEDLPKEELATMLLEKFEPVDILSLMQENSMDKFLMQPKAERKYAQKYFENLHGKELEEIIVSVYGDNYKNKPRDEYVEKIQTMNEDKFNSFLLSMDKKNKVNLIDNMISQEPDLMLLIDNDDLVKPMNFLMKDDKIKLMKNLEKEFIIPMIQELPIDLTQIVTSQINPRDFAEILARDYKDILSSVVLFSNKS